MHATGSVEGALKAVMDWYQPKGDADRDHLEREFDILMQGDEDPKLFFASAEGKLKALSSFGIHMLGREVVRILTHPLPSEVYDVEQRTNLLRPGITRSEMEEMFRTSHANGETKTLE